MRRMPAAVAVAAFILITMRVPSANALDLRYWRDFAFGAAASIVVHEAGHCAVIASEGEDFWFVPHSTGIEIRGTFRTSYRIDMAGFTAQHAVGTALTQWKPRAAFVKGYNVCSALGTWTYPLRYGWDRGDLRGGRRLEYGMFSAIAAVNLYRIEW